MRMGYRRDFEKRNKMQTLSLNNNQWMQEALKLASLAAKAGEVPVGAVLIKDGEVLGRGQNQRERAGRTVGHAEIQALEDYSARTGQWRLPPETLLVVTAEPCLMCTGALLWARVDKIVFGCSDPKGAGIMGLLPTIESGLYDHRFSLVTGGVMAAECGDLMKAFFQARRAFAKSDNAVAPGAQTFGMV